MAAAATLEFWKSKTLQRFQIKIILNLLMKFYQDLKSCGCNSRFSFLKMAAAAILDFLIDVIRPNIGDNKMLHSNYVSILHRLGAIGGYRPLWSHQGHPRSKVKLPLDQSGHAEHFCLWAPLPTNNRLGATGEKLSWPSFDLFEIIKIKGHARFRIPGVKFI